MNLFESLLWHLSGKMEIPPSFGVFHLICIAITVSLTAFICLRFGKASAKTEKIILLIIWAVMVLFESYKQLIYAVQFTDPVTWDYQWYSFPFQFCSTPLYLIPFAALPKSETIRDTVRMFLSTYSLFGGLIVLMINRDVASAFIGVNIQTMLHHGSMVLIGIYLGGRLIRENKMNLKLFLKGGVLFLILFVIAFLLNIAAPLFTDDVFNMFYIGPRFPCTMFFGSWVYAVCPYPIFLIIYILVFTGAALLMYLGQKYIRVLFHRKPVKTGNT